MPFLTPSLLPYHDILVDRGLAWRQSEPAQLCASPPSAVFPCRACPQCTFNSLWQQATCPQVQLQAEEVRYVLFCVQCSAPALGKCRSGGGCIIVGHVFLQLPVSVSSRNKQGYAWLALHEVAAKRRPRSGILQLTHSCRPGSENCNLHFLPLPLISTGG